MNDPRLTFLYIHYMDVHAPYLGNPELPELGSIDGRYDRRLTTAERRAIPRYLALESVKDLGTYLDAYDRGIQDWDASFGKFVDWLDETGRLERSIVAVTSDHGEELLEHGGWNHGLTVFEEQIRVPWILRVPGAPGRRAIGLTSLIDVAPTLLALAGVPVPDSMTGVNLLEGEGPDLGRAVFSETHIRAAGASSLRRGPPMVAMRRGDLKWIVDNARRRCFDLAHDPREKREAECDPAGFEEVTRWTRELEREGAALGETGEFEASPEQRRRLRELGYLE